MMNGSYEESSIKLMVGHLEEEGWRKEASCPPGWKARLPSKDTTGVEMEYLSPSMEIFPGILEMLTYSKQAANNSDDLDNVVDASNTIDNILDDTNTMLLQKESENELHSPTKPSPSRMQVFSITPSSSKPNKQTLSTSPPAPPSSSLEKRKAFANSASSKKPRMEPRVKPTVSSPKKSGFEIMKANVLDPATSEKLTPPVMATPLAPSLTLPKVDSSLQITKVPEQ